jgi:hypothetical protein
MSWRRRLWAVAVLAVAMLATAWVASAHTLPVPGDAGELAQPEQDVPGAGAVLEWNAIAQNAVVASGRSPAEGFVYFAYAQAAVYDAVVSIEGGYEPYSVSIRAARDASPEAAAATAAHDTLAGLFPTQRSTLDYALSASLARIGDGRAKQQGVAVGRATAAALLALRADDGRDAAVGYTPPTGLGAWQPTPPAFLPVVAPWLATMRPFVLDSPSRFRPPAPSLGSDAYARDLNEIRQYGAATSTVRTPEQTETARFWGANAAAQYNEALRGVASKRDLDGVDAARLLASVDVTGADAIIACWDAKLAYGFWRPVTAIRAGGDAGWTPLLTTPNHPEYPSAHGCVSSAVAEALSQFLGTSRIDLDVSSSVTGTTRHYATAAGLLSEIRNARVWAGLHFRTSTVVGMELGQRVARYDLRHSFGKARP